MLWPFEEAAAAEFDWDEERSTLLDWRLICIAFARAFSCVRTNLARLYRMLACLLVLLFLFCLFLFLFLFHVCLF